MNCNDCKEQLVDFLYEEMSAEKRGAFAEHLACCASCRAEVEGFRRTLGNTRSALSGPLAQRPPSRVHDRIMEAARASAAERRAKKTESTLGFFARLWRTPWLLPAFGAASVATVVFMVRVLKNPVIIPGQEPQSVGELVAPAAPPSPAPSPALEEGEAIAKAPKPKGELASEPAGRTEPTPAGKAERRKGRLGMLADRGEATSVDSLSGFSGSGARAISPAAGGLGADKAVAAHEGPAKKQAARVSEPPRELAEAPGPRRFAEPPPAKEFAAKKQETSATNADPGVVVSPKAKVAAEKDFARMQAPVGAPAPAARAPSPAPAMAPAPVPAAEMEMAAESEQPTSAARARWAPPAPTAAKTAATAKRADDEAAQRSPASADDVDEAKATKRDAPPSLDESIRRADRLFADQRWSSAAEAYRDLLRRYPSHKDAGKWRVRIDQSLLAERAARQPAAAKATRE